MKSALKEKRESLRTQEAPIREAIRVVKGELMIQSMGPVDPDVECRKLYEAHIGADELKPLLEDFHARYILPPTDPAVNPLPLYATDYLRLHATVAQQDRNTASLMRQIEEASDALQQDLVRMGDTRQWLK